MSQRHATSTFPSRNVWWDTPTAFKAGVVVGILGWFVSLSSSDASSRNGVLVDCHYTDLAKIGVAILLVVLAASGVLARRRELHRLPTWLTAVIVLALVVDAVFLALKGLDIYPGVCRALLNTG